MGLWKQPSSGGKVLAHGLDGLGNSLRPCLLTCKQRSILFETKLFIKWLPFEVTAENTPLRGGELREKWMEGKPQVPRTPFGLEVECLALVGERPRFHAAVAV